MWHELKTTKPNKTKLGVLEGGRERDRERESHIGNKLANIHVD